jgi:hypothetical protein
MMTLKKRQQMERKFDQIGTLSESESELHGSAYYGFMSYRKSVGEPNREYAVELDKADDRPKQPAQVASGYPILSGRTVRPERS